MPAGERALRVTHVLHRDAAGGGPRVVWQLISGLGEGFEPSLVCAGRGDLSARCRDVGVPVVEVPGETLGGAVAGFRSWVKALRGLAPDVVVLHGQWAGPVGGLAARAAGVRRAVYVAHCPAFYHSTTLVRVVRNYVAEKIPCRLADRVVVLSVGNHYGYLYRGWAPERNLVRIPNGIEELPSDTGDPLRAEEKWSSDEVHAVFAGRLDDQKRVDWLLEAWAVAVRRAQAKARLWIVGDGRERGALEALSSRLDIPVVFVGARPDARRWIAAADFVAMSSLYEGHALVPLEAMACGKPVAAFATDGVTDSVVSGETGLLAPLGDIEALGVAMARLINDALLRQTLGRAGRTRAREVFPLSSTLQAYRDLLHDLCR